jgi:lipoate---protein ligase
MDKLEERPVTIDCRANLALDEALLRARAPAPVMRVWVSAPCVVVGRGQLVSRAVDLAACARDGIPVYRRATGGGAVFQDTGSVTLTLLRPGWHPEIRDELAALVARALSGLGLKPDRGDRGVQVDGTEVARLATRVTATASLAHATLMVSTPADRPATYLLPAPSGRGRPVTAPIPACPLTDHLPALGLASACAAVAQATQRDGPARSRPPTADEARWRDLLLAARYLHDSWHLAGVPERLPEPDGPPGAG